MTDLSPAPIPTGRYIVRFDPNANGHEIGKAMDTVQTLDADSILNVLKVSVADISASQAQALAAADGVIDVRPEFYLFDVGISEKTLKWMQEGLRLYIDGLEADIPGPWPWPEDNEPETRFSDSTDLTWGLAAVGAPGCQLSGKGIKVAVLDTGIDAGHPDFFGSTITAENFSRDATPLDGNGHGTHVAGTIAGPLFSQLGRRYGVAPAVELYIGKVLANNGAGYEFDVLRGIEWAINQGCHIISMSLGRAVRSYEKPDPLYEAVGQAALERGSLIIAAAGNESARQYGYTAPVGSPANASTIMAVGAVDPLLRVSSFSCGATGQAGGEVDICGPGSAIYSAWPQPRLSRTISGTSMATPHVSGVAALLAEAFDVRGRDLWNCITQLATPLGDRRDYGAGLVQVPHG